MNCRLGDVNEVFCNLLSNAVHAIEDSSPCGQGLIRPHTRTEGEGVGESRNLNRGKDDTNLRITDL